MTLLEKILMADDKNCKSCVHRITLESQYGIVSDYCASSNKEGSSPGYYQCVTERHFAADVGDSCGSEGTKHKSIYSQESLIKEYKETYGEN